MEYEIYIFETKDGKKPYIDWVSTLDLKSQARVDNRISRLRQGNFGDHCSVGDKIFELRFFFGSGYRVYYGVKDERVILLISGGDKKTQKKDIKRAKELWSQYLEEDYKNAKG